MSLKNIWRLRFFINRYSPSDKKKRYMNNKLDELEVQIEKMKCKNKYVVSDKNSNAVPCYTVRECKCCKYSESVE